MPSNKRLIMVTCLIQEIEMRDGLFGQEMSTCRFIEQTGAVALDREEALRTAFGQVQGLVRGVSEEWIKDGTVYRAVVNEQLSEQIPNK